MYEYDEECLQVFLDQQGKLFDEPVAGTPEEAEAFLEDCMAVVVDSIQEVESYFQEETGRITAGVPDDAPFDLVDLGICKLHFEIGMRELFPQCRFAWGNGGAFNPAA